MKQLPGGNSRFLSIPKPNSKKSNNESQKDTSSNENDNKELKDLKEKYEILKMQFSKLQSQFKLYKIETMTQINKINYEKNYEINAIKKEKEEIQINNEKEIHELTDKINKISVNNQSLVQKCNDLNNELAQIKEENKHLKEQINKENLEENQINNEKIKQDLVKKKNDAFHYQPQENKNEQTSPNAQQSKNIALNLPPCIENKTNDNFPVFNPKEKVYYLFFPEKTQPNYHKSFKKDLIYGVHDAIDIQRFHYYPESKKIYTFIGFSNEEVRNNWISIFTTKSISYDRLVYAFPFCKSHI